MSPASGRRTVERIADALRSEILAGRLEAGAPLREEALSARFEASRHTVRTALSMLEAEKLVASEAYRGARVAQLDERQLVELQQVRAAIESEAVLAVQAGADADPVLAAIDRLERAHADGEEWIEVERAHAAVHQALVDLAGNRRLSEIYRTLEGELSLLLLHARDVFAGRDLAAEHRAWLRDVRERGAAAVREHLDGSTADLLALRGATEGGSRVS